MAPKYRRDLRREMVKGFDSAELRTIAFDLGIEWGELRGETNSEKVTAMISHQMRKGKLEELITVLKEERPEGEWPGEIPSPEQQIVDEKADISEEERRAILDKILNIVGPLASSAMQIKAVVEADLGYLDPPQTAILVRLLAGAGLVSYINLEGVVLRGESLRGADLSGANLRGADLSGAILSRANLSDAKLSGAKLSGANLRYTDLPAANLYKANLGGADLSGAYLRWSNMKEADLSRANLSEAELTEARYNKETIWPEGFEPEEHGLILIS